MRHPLQSNRPFSVRSWPGYFGILINIPWPRFFERKHLGAVNGWVTGATVVTSAMGPFLFGLSATALRRKTFTVGRVDGLHQ